MGHPWLVRTIWTGLANGSRYQRKRAGWDAGFRLASHGVPADPMTMLCQQRAHRSTGD
ncbi:camp protein [Ahrensia sp. R2A130]|nr:camp protein [Ahrensia sp. R2A130]